MSTIFALLDLLTSEGAALPSFKTRLSLVQAEVQCLAELLSTTEDEASTDELVDVGSMLAGICAAAGVSSECHIQQRLDPDLLVLATVVTLRRALRNIVANAVRAVGGAGEICAAARRVGATVVIEVGDSGPGFGGIPAQQGLGLLAAQRLTVTCGGSLRVGQASLGGALVELTLPAADVGDWAQEELA